MPRRTVSTASAPKPFDEASYAIIVGMIDAAEDYLVEHGICKPEAAHARLTLDYIKRVAGMIDGASFYVKSDERIGADLFLMELPDARKKIKGSRRREACIEMLFERPSAFFPEYGVLLRYLMNCVLEKPGELHWSSILKLAASTLPGGRAEIRREMRRRGERECNLVCDDYMKQRMLPANDLDSVLFFGTPKQMGEDKL